MQSYCNNWNQDSDKELIGIKINKNKSAGGKPIYRLLNLIIDDYTSGCLLDYNYLNE